MKVANMRKRKAIFVALVMACTPFAFGSGAQAQSPYPQGPYGAPGYHRPPPPPPPGYRRGPPPRAEQHYGWRKRGGRLPPGQGYVVSDYRRHGLRQPPRGYRWVRTGNDYVLAAAATGIISSIIRATQ
ncbi:MAG: hypothetical protein B7Y70_10420 [Rhizobiales bacterium 35-68-8]|nr:MAG: hypothetical protein B7Y70_10420 [Rhizobiales bacterium 35-68-8]